MEIIFENIHFNVSDEDKRITVQDFPITEVQISGENKNSHMGVKMIHGSCGEPLRYLFHEIRENTLYITQGNNQVEVTTVFRAFSDTNALQVYSTVRNLTQEKLPVEEISALTLNLQIPLSQTDKAWIYTFCQSHHGECQARAHTLYDLGLSDLSVAGPARVSQHNVGSWSTKEALPQAIVSFNGTYTMFQLESNQSWYYELSDRDGEIYAWLGGANLTFGGWQKILEPGQEYRTNTVAFCTADSLNGVLGEMTKYRRHVAGRCAPDNDLPAIFNEYMHLSWDSPSEENVRKYAPRVAKAGVEYYVIDCGWHNEEPGNIIYPYVGQWKESNARFPQGLRKTTDYIRSLGMKPGLWIEPEVVGYKCNDMLSYYDDDCFVQRNGKRICVGGRYFLDFRNKKVVDYLTETICRMVEEYGAEYIKLDYNQDMGIGTDLHADCAAEGLEQCAKAYLAWIDSIRARFPNVLFETCSGGGMRMDYETMQHFSIVSTSDQIRYKRYPYIAGNVTAAVLPEQAAVWSYPVGSPVGPNDEFNPTTQWVEDNISHEQVIMNMINAFVGRVHLASHIELLSEEKFDLVKEGISYYNHLTQAKKTALPYLPLGFADGKKELVSSGLVTEDTLYLAVWNLDSTGIVKIPVGDQWNHVQCTYPQSNGLRYALNNGVLEITFTQSYQARFFECKK